MPLVLPTISSSSPASVAHLSSLRHVSFRSPHSMHSLRALRASLLATTLAPPTPIESTSVSKESARAARKCVARESLIADVLERYVDSVNTGCVPLVLHGKPAVGKTAVLAKVIAEVRKRKIPVIERYIATSTDGMEARALIASLIRHIHALYNKKVSESRLAPSALLHDMVSYMHETINSLPGPDAPLVIAIDALESIRVDKSPGDLRWFPRKWTNPHLKIIATFSHSEDLHHSQLGKTWGSAHTGPRRNSAAPAATSLSNVSTTTTTSSSSSGSAQAENESIWVHVPVLLNNEAERIVAHWNSTSMGGAAVDIADIKALFLGEQVIHIYHPLVLKTLYRAIQLEIPRHEIYDCLGRLPPNTESYLVALAALQLVIHHLRRKYGSDLVDHALGFITCSGASGIMQEELLAVLANDTDVKLERQKLALQSPAKTAGKQQLQGLSIRSVWDRLRKDLGDFVTEHPVDGHMCYLLPFHTMHEAVESVCLDSARVEGGLSSIMNTNHETGVPTSDLRIYWPGTLRMDLHEMLAQYFAGDASAAAAAAAAASGGGGGGSFSGAGLGIGGMSARGGLGGGGGLESSIGAGGVPGAGSNIAPPPPMITWFLKDDFASFDNRRLSKLVYHQIRAGMMTALASETLCSLEYIIAKHNLTRGGQALRQEIDDALQLVEDIGTFTEGAKKLAALVKEIGSRTSSANTESPATTVLETCRFLRRWLREGAARHSSWLQLALDEPEGSVAHRLGKDFLRRARNPLFAQSPFASQVRGVWHRQLMWKKNSVKPKYHLTLEGHTSEVTTLFPVPGKNQVVSGSMDRSVRVWQFDTGRMLVALVHHTGRVNSVAVNPAGTLAASGSSDRTVVVWNLATGSPLFVLAGHLGSVRCVAFSPDGSLLFSGSDDRTVRIWAVSTGECLETLDGHTAPVHSIAVTANGPNGLYVVSGTGDAHIHVHKRKSSQSEFELLRVLEGHKGIVRSIVVIDEDTASSGSGSAGGNKMLVTAGDDRIIRAWSLQEGTVAFMLVGHNGVITSLCHLAAGDALASSSADGTIRLWSLTDRALLRTLEGHRGNVWCVSSIANGEMIMSAGADNLIHTWTSDITAIGTPTTARPRGMPHKASVRSIALSPDNKTVASVAEDKHLNIWQRASGEIVQTIQLPWIVRSIAYLPDGESLVCAGDEKWVMILPVTRELLPAGNHLRFQGHTDWVKAVAVCAKSPITSSAMVVSGGLDDTVRLWSASSRELLRTFEARGGGVTAVGVSQDGRFTVAGCFDKFVCVWSSTSGQMLHQLTGHSHWVTSVQFSPDMRSILSASFDETLRLWSIDSGECKHVLRGHARAVLCAGFLKDSDHIVSSSEDSSIILWHLKASAPQAPHNTVVRVPEIIQSLHAHSDSVFQVVAAADGRSIFSGGQDGQVHRWVELNSTENHPHSGSIAAAAGLLPAPPSPRATLSPLSSPRKSQLRSGR